MMTKKIALIMVAVAVIAGTAGFLAEDRIRDILGIYDKHEFSIKDIPEEERCYRGTGVWSKLSPKVRHPDFYQGLERIAIYFDHNLRDVMYCMDGLNEDECKKYISKEFKGWDTIKKETDHRYEIYKKSYESYPEFIRPKALFESAKKVLEPTLGQCGGKEKPITLHYFPTDDVFYQKGTLGIYVEVEILTQEEKYYFKINKYRSDKSTFSNMKNSTWVYFESIKNLSSEDREKLIRSNFYKALIK